MDVGTGSGILAIWSAQAGARKVYAVEATKMSEHARELIKANKLQDVVEVIEGSMEDIVLPEKGLLLMHNHHHFFYFFLSFSLILEMINFATFFLNTRIFLLHVVDVIISEWMGYFLLRESMLDSVLCARDRWLNPDGVMLVLFFYE